MSEVKGSNPGLFLAVDNTPVQQGRASSSSLSGSSRTLALDAPATASADVGRPASAAQSLSPAELPDKVAAGQKLEQEQNKVEREELKSAVSKLNDYVQSVQRDLLFEADEESGVTVIRVVDQATQKVVRQIPDEVALQLAQKLQQNEPISLLNIKV